MAVTLRLRKIDLEMLAEVDTVLGALGDEISSKQLKAWSNFYDRVVAAELKPRRSKPAGISVMEAIETFRGVLGKRLVVPAGQATAMWWAPLQKRISASGLTRAHCEEAARVAAATWKGPIKAESIIRQADTLLSEYQAEVSDLAPLEVEDMQEL